MKNLPDSLSQLLSLAAQSSSARSTKPLPLVPAQHQAVQQELILGEASEWRNLLVRVLPGLKQVAECSSLCFASWTYDVVDRTVMTSMQ